MSTLNRPSHASSAIADPLLVWRKEVPILAPTTYMISHSLGPMPLRAEAALRGFTQTWATRGIRAWEEGWWDMPITCGDLIGELIGAQAPRSHAPERLDCQSIVTSYFDWGGKRNKLVTDGLNFPSNDYISHELEHQVASIVSVRSEDGITVAFQQILAAIDEQMLLVSISHVAFRSSALQDLAAITKHAHAKGAYVVADLYQSAGIVLLNVVDLDVDFATAGSIKWLLEGRVPGISMSADLDEILRPGATGWAAHAHLLVLREVPSSTRQTSDDF